MELPVGRRASIVRDLCHHRRPHGAVRRARGEFILLSMSIAAPWLAAGVGVTGVLLGGPRLWPAVFVGSWVVWGVIVGDPPVSVTLDAVAEAGSILLIAHLLSVWGFHRSFDRFRDPLILLAAATRGALHRRLARLDRWICIGVAGARLPCALLSSDHDRASGAFPVSDPGDGLEQYSLGANSIAGIILVVPLFSARLEDLQRSGIFDIRHSLLAHRPGVARLERRRVEPAPCRRCRLC